MGTTRRGPELHPAGEGLGGRDVQDGNPQQSKDEGHKRRTDEGQMGRPRGGAVGQTSSSTEARHVRDLEENSAITGETSSFADVTKERLKCSAADFILFTG